MSFNEKRSRIRRVAEIAAESPLGHPAPPAPTGPEVSGQALDWRVLCADSPYTPEVADARARVIAHLKALNEDYRGPPSYDREDSWTPFPCLRHLVGSTCVVATPVERRSFTPAADDEDPT